MFRTLLLRTTMAAFALGSISASANQVVDLFSDDQAYFQASNSSNSASATGADILGGERDIILTAAQDARVSAEVRNNQLLIASSGLGNGGAVPADESWGVEVQWDGLDNSSALDVDGLAPAADFSTLNGFSADINSSDGDGAFIVTINDTFGTSAIKTFGFTKVDLGSPQTFSIPFSLFTAVSASLDLSSIGSIVLNLASSGDTDIRVAAIRAVPAPSSLAILGLGLIGFAGLARRKA
ncbi:PEP-CTERM sorting domain-containing protein [Paraglaciecola aquimarina]|uniref:PEP-CTERM sorting domain-containing protein n=1 Tax=Paraglaciecola aquimarina TaxID=1235557 RepID=A0ABU3T252_9ALTE|nr:PEP-CTERM sorting domain-containing protein [Paraglaciecola aquimarina]MDU0356345.1 PEP-CTERM sorting domain-containing protein [Paraglaciecola aquimarina]MDU0356346.1 PEP-CTERM sorting domain-containing protein [Paraglaciecola aquimarina]